MSTTEKVEINEEEVPQFITEEFFSDFRPKVQTTLKNLLKKEENELANEVNKLLTVAENLRMNLRDEQAKNRNLEENQVNAKSRIDEAVKISQKDQDTINKLRNEVIETWKLVDKSQTKEIESSEAYHQLHKKFESVETELKRLSVQFDDNDVNPLGKHKVTVIEECHRLNEEVKNLNKRIQIERDYSDEIQKKLDDSLAANQELYHQWDEATNDDLSNKKKIKNLESVFEQTTGQLDEMTNSMNHFKNQSQNFHARLAKRDGQLKAARDELEKLREEKTLSTLRTTAMQNDIEKYKDEMKLFTIKSDQMKNFLRLKEDEIRKVLLENEQHLKNADVLMRKISSLQKAEVKSLSKITNLQNEILTAGKELDSIKKANDNIKRDKDNLEKKNGNLVLEIEKRDEMVNLIKSEKSTLEENLNFVEKDLKLSTARERKATQTIKMIHTRLETIQSEKLYLEESAKELNDIVKKKDQEVIESKSKLDELNKELSHSKHEFNLSVKQLKEARADFQKCHEKEADYKERNLKCRHQVEDKTSKLLSKIAENSNLLKKIKTLEKRNRELKRDLEHCRDAQKMTQDELKSVRFDNKNCKEVLRENDVRFVKMKSGMDKLLRERDLIANQMIRRTDENELLGIESSALKASIEQGKASYNDRLKDIELMKNEILNLRSQCNILKRSLENTTDMRHEVLQLHRQLNQERVQSKVLLQEIRTPMNVHRWRKLERIDKKRVNLTKKFRNLQRESLQQTSMIKKSEEIIKTLEAKIELIEMEKSRLAGVKVHEKLLLTRSQLSNNTKRMKAAIAISQANVGDLKLKDNEIEKLKKDNYDLKADFFKEKREKSELQKKLQDLKKIMKNEKEPLKKLGGGDSFITKSSENIKSKLSKIEIKFPK